MLTYELEQAQKRQRDLYLDLDGRLRKLEAGAGAAPAAAAPSGPPPAAEGAPAPTPGAAAPSGTQSRTLAGAADVVTEQRAYDAALDQFKNGSYAAAIASFQTFARANPKSQFCVLRTELMVEVNDIRIVTLEHSGMPF